MLYRNNKLLYGKHSLNFWVYDMFHPRKLVSSYVNSIYCIFEEVSKRKYYVTNKCTEIINTDK